MVTHIAPSSPSHSSVSFPPPSPSSYFPPYTQSAIGTAGHPPRYRQASSVAGYQPSYQLPSASPRSAYAQTTYNPSRAPSVSSRASTSAVRRSHDRHHRSHGRSNSSPLPQPQNAFPWFSQSGDVEIVVCDRSRQKEKRFMLHALILAQNSGWFTEDLGEDVAVAALDGGATDINLANIRDQGGSRDFWSGSKTTGTDRSNKRRWRYEINWRNVQSGTAPPLLVQRNASDSLVGPPPARNKPPPSGSSFFRGIASSLYGGSNSRRSTSLPDTSKTTTEDDDLLYAYENLFRIYYNHAPLLDSINIANAYVECKLLLSLASQYNCLSVVGPRVDHHLLRFHGQLWKQIAKYPPSYLKLAYLARSRALFAEALVHVVGQWPAASSQLRRGTVDDVVLDLIEDKVDELEELKSRIDAKIFRLSLTTSRGDRVNPGTAWLDWLAVSLFRQWFAENTTSTPPGILKESRDTNSGRRTSRPPESTSTRSRASSSQRQGLPAYGSVYRQMSFAGETYLSHDELKKFLRMRPGPADEYSRESLRKFERRMDELKNLARDVVKPLTRNFLQFDTTALGVNSLPHLTSTRMEESDWRFVWGE